MASVDKDKILSLEALRHGLLRVLMGDMSTDSAVLSMLPEGFFGPHPRENGNPHPKQASDLPPDGEMLVLPTGSDQMDIRETAFVKIGDQSPDV